MALDPGLASTVLRVVDAINQRDQRARGLASPRGIGRTPDLGAGNIAPSPPVPVVNAFFNNLGSAIHDTVLPGAAAQTTHTPTGAVIPLPPAGPTPLPTAATQPPPVPTPGPGLPTLDFLSGLNSPGDVLGRAVGALDAPRGEVAAHEGEVMYRYVTGQASPAERVVDENIPFRRFLFEWAAQNPDLVRSAYEQGFDSRDGQTHFTGGRAVWEAYARQEQTGNWKGVVTSTVMDPLNLLGGPGEMVGTGIAERAGLAAAEHTGALGAAMHGVALGGRGLAATDRAYQTAAGLIPKAIGAGARQAARAPGINRVAAQVGRWFEASPQAKALRDLNAVLAARQQRTAAEARAPGAVIDPHGISPGDAPAAEAIGAVATEAPARYEEAFTSRRETSIARAGERARTRIMDLADAAPEGPVRDQIHALWDQLAEDRQRILSSTERRRTLLPDERNAANRADLFTAELETEHAARQALLDAGLTPPPHRNVQVRDSVAANLDTLAWNPDDAAATAARDALLVSEQKAVRDFGEQSTAVASLRDAREMAEQNRLDLEATPTAPATITEPAPDAHLEGMPAADQQAWHANLRSQNGRATDFQAADARLRQAYERVGAAFEGADDGAYHAAARAYTDAWQGAQRLLEVAKREDDAIAARFAAGGITPPDVQQAILGGGEAARAAMAEADRSFTLGPIEAPEVGQTLARTFQRNPQYLGQTFGDVASRIETRVGEDKNRLLQLLSRATTDLSTKETTELNKLLKRYPHVSDLASASRMNPAAELRRELHGAFNVEHGADAATRFGRTLDTASRIYQRNLLMPWSFVRYYLGNLTGDNWQVLLTHGPQAALAIDDPQLLRDLTLAAVKGGDVTVGAVGDLAKRAGLGGFHPSLVTENLAEAIWRREQTAINRAGGRSRFNLLGTVDQATGRITDLPRNLANGLEWAHRTGLWAFLLQHELPARKASWVREMAPLAEAKGIAESTLRQLIDGLPDVVDGSEVASAVGKLAQGRGLAADEAKGLAEELGRKWASQVYQADEAARAGVNKALFSYEQKNIDAWTRRIIPFHMWQSRAIPFYAEQVLRHPGFGAAYYRLYQATKESAEEQGWPAPLRTMLTLWHGPGGMMGMVNPLAVIGVMDFAFETNGGYTDDNVSAVGQFFQNASDYGATLLPWWGAALNLAGYMGDTSLNLDPIGTSQARRFVGALIQGAAGQGLLGADKQMLLGKPYEQKLQDLRGALSGYLPGSVEIPVNDPNAAPAIQIRNIMLRNELAQRKMTLNQYLQLGAEAQKDASGEAAQLLDDINETVAAEEADGGAPYIEATREWSQSNALATAINSIIPGPKAVRQEDSLAIQSLAGSYFAGEDGVIPGVGPVPTPGHDPSDLTDARDADFIRRWHDRFGADYRTGDLARMQQAALDANTAQNASPESAPYLEQQDAYYSLGTDRERQLLDTYYQIAYAETGINMPNMRPNGRLIRGEHAGLTWMSQEDLASLDQQTRWDLADAWLSAVDRDGEAGRVRELRDLYESTHPEFAAYQQWQRGTRKQWGTAGAFRAAAVRANPNYARFIQQETAKLRAKGLTPSAIATELDSRGLSLDAYFAYNGMRGSRYDPAPLDLGTPLPVASEGATGEGMGGNGGDSGQPWGEQVKQALEDNEAAMRASQQYLGIRLDQLPDMIANAYLRQPDYPEEAKPPRNAWIANDYRDFAWQQSQLGGDTSVEAFIAATSSDPTEGAPQYQPGVWPPQELPRSPQRLRSPRNR